MIHMRYVAQRLVAAAVILGSPASLVAVQRPVSAMDVAGIDRSVAPGNAFFQYANGAWFSANDIPPDRSSYGTDAMLAELTSKRVAALMQDATGPVGDYFASFMDGSSVERRGLQPLRPALSRIASLKDRKGLAALLGSNLRADVDALNSTDFYTDNIFGLWVAQDLDDPNRYLPFLLQGGLGLPDRDFYLDPSPQKAQTRKSYQAHLRRVLQLAEIADPEDKAARVFDLETRIAKVHASRQQSADVRLGDNHWTREQFDKRAPGLDWQEYFAAADLASQKEFIVWHPAALSGISALVASAELETWKAYLTLRLLEHYSSVLPAAFVNEQFGFYGHTLSGTPQLRDRWKRAVEATNEALGEAVGQIYVKKYFPPAEKLRAEKMVRNLMQAFSARIDRLAWMTPQTKIRAKAKLGTLKVGVGYPDKWRDYSALRVIRDDALGNLQRAELFEYRRSLGKLGKPVDRGEWVMTPQTVNAVNLPVMNAMNFPAAILQPPFFDAHRPAALDYGATGATIGHELSHSFDDQGALFDESGRLHNWWTPEDLAHFQASGAQLAAQYDRYQPFADLHLNGKLTLSENIADLAGLAAAYDAYRLSLRGADAPQVEGYSGDQQFFVSYAQSWRRKTREPALRVQVTTDGHAPEEYRADTVRNLDAWYAAFDVKPGQLLYLAPKQRVTIW